MTDTLLIIIIVMITYLIYLLKGRTENKTMKRKKPSYETVLPEYLHKICEIRVKEPLAALDIMFSVKGILTDYDEEWLMIRVETKKKTTDKLFRIGNITSIKEIR